MMPRLPVLLIIIASQLFALIGDNELRGQAADELFTAAPEKVVCSGRVVDEAGKPVADAIVSLVAPHGVAYVITGRICNRPATLATATDADGAFTLEFRSDDARFFGTGNFIMMVQADGFATDAVEVSMDRLLVDLPFDIDLTHSQPIPLRIQDAAGRPAAGVHVRVARLNKVLLPLQLKNNPTVETSATGVAILPGCDKSALRSIYVESEAVGSQLLPVQTDRDGLYASLMPSLQVDGQVALPEAAEPISFESRLALVGSMQSKAFSVEGPASFSWQIVTLAETGTFSSSKIAAGTLSFQFIDGKTTVCQSLADRYNVPELTLGNSPLAWKLTFKPARETVFKIVGEDGEPIPNLWLADSSAGVLNPAGTRTNEQGKVSLFFPEHEKPGGQLFPMDVFRRTALEPFGIILDRRPYQDDGSPKPIRLGRSRLVAGRVIDEQANSVAGASVSYSYGEERFTRDEKTFTDKFGRFRIRGLPPNAALEVKARKGAAMTQPNEAVNVVAGTTGEVTLQLVEQPTAALVGRVVDRDRQPVANARVAINRVTVLQKEGYSAEQTQGAPWFPELPSVSTGADGSFRFPATPGFTDRMQISIQASGYRPFRAPFVKGSRQEFVDGELRLGEFRLLSVPQVAATVRCVDHATGQPISAAKVVFMGVHAGRTSATTDDSGTVAVTLSDTSQIVAVQAEGYAILFQHAGHVAELLELKLDRPTAVDLNQRLAWFDRNQQTYLEPANQLFRRLKMPSPGESTFYRQLRYFGAMALLEPESLENTLSNPNSGYKHRNDFLGMQLPAIVGRSPDQAIRMLMASKIGAQQKASFMAQFAGFHADPDLKDELFGEAVLLLGSMSGSQHLVTAGYVARGLILDGRIETARSVVQSVWDAADEPRRQLADRKRKNGIAESRIFYPLLALVDLDAALQLIELSAPQREVEQLQDEAFGVLSFSDWQQFQEACQQHDHHYNGGSADWILRVESSGIGRPGFAQWAVKAAEVLEDSTTRLGVCLYAARNLPPGEQRERMISLAIHAWKHAPVREWYHWADPAKTAVEQIAYFDTIQAHELDRLVFACFSRAPESFDSMNLRGVLGDAARLLSIRDANLGRSLLEPNFDDSVWLFDHVGRTWFDQNIALQSTVWVDPAWAADVAEQWSDRYSPDDPVRQLQLFGSIIREMRTLVGVVSQ